MAKTYVTHELLLLETQQQIKTHLKAGDLMYAGAAERPQIEDILKRNNITYQVSEASPLGIHTITVG